MTQITTGATYAQPRPCHHHRRHPPMLRIEDHFCGAGGNTTGALLVDDVEVVHAANHAPPAIATHSSNYPTVEHTCGDIPSMEPKRYPTGFPIPAPRRVLVCQFELPVPQFVSRLAIMRRVMGIGRRSQPLGRYARHRPSAQRAAGTESLPLRRPGRRRRDHRSGPALLHARSGRKRHPRHGRFVPEPAAPARCFPRRADRGAPCAQIDRPLRDRQRLPRLQRPACGGRQLLAADAGLRPSSTPSNCASSSATPLRNRHACSISIPIRCGSLPPASRRQRSRPRGARWSRPTSPQALAELGERGALQPTARANHDAHRVFQAHRATGHYRGLPARLDRAGRRPLPLAACSASSVAGIDCPHGVAPGRMPKADATELAPKKSAYETLRHTFIRAGGFLFATLLAPPVPLSTLDLKVKPISLVRLPSGGLGL